jgi:hypothetical protein
MDAVGGYNYCDSIMAKIISQTKVGYYDDLNGKVHTGRRMGIGQNVAWQYTYTHSLPFINVIKHVNVQGSSYTANPGTLDANGYPSVEFGGRYQLVTNPQGWIKSGTWILMWDGTADVTWALSGTTEGTPVITGGADNRREYTITFDQVTDSSGYVRVQGPGTCTNLRLITPGEEARHDAGEVLTTQYLTEMAGISILRTMNWSWVNNWAPQVEIADFRPYSYMSWGQNIADINGNRDYGREAPFEVMAKAANEIDCHLHVTLPHQMSDAAMTWAANVFKNTLNSHLKLYVELANEIFNFTYPQTHWFNYADAPLHIGTVDPVTGIVTDTAHGFTTGDEIRTHDTMEHSDSFYGGNEVWVIVDSVNTYRITNNDTRPRDITGAALTNPCEITLPGHTFNDGDTDIRIDQMPGDFGTNLNGNDYTITVTGTDTFTLNSVDSSTYAPYTSGGIAIQPVTSNTTLRNGPYNIPDNVTTFRCHKMSESSLNRFENYGDRMVEMWDIFRGVLGDQCVRVMGGWSNGASQIRDIMTRAGAREKFDVIALAHYCGRKVSGIPNLDMAQKTPAEITAYMINNVMPLREIPNFYAQVAEAKTYRFINYECGNHLGAITVDNSDPTNDEWVPCMTWFFANPGEDGAYDFYEYYWKELATMGFQDSIHYTHTASGTQTLDTPPSSRVTTGPFGMLVETGDPTTPEYLATRVYWDAGGAPKK